MQTKYISYPPAGRHGLLRKVVAVAWTVVLVGLALMFSAMLLTVILIVAVIGGAYLWWKTRELRKQFKEMQARMGQMHESAAGVGEPQGGVSRGEVFEGEIIEGKVIRVREIDAHVDR